MAYEYSDPTREDDPHALPDVEVFQMTAADAAVGEVAFQSVDGWYQGPGYYYAYGFPGCLWDGDPCGPFDSYEAALQDARLQTAWYGEDEA